MIGNPGVRGVARGRRERVTTMQRVRRIASAAVAAACAVTALAACRADPEVAAYIGAQKVTAAEVDAIYADAKAKLAAAGGQPDRLTLTRPQIVEALLGADVLPRAAQKRHVQPVSVPADQVAQLVNLPPTAQFVNLYTKYRSYLSGLTSAAKPAAVTVGQLRDVYERLKAANALGPQAPSFEAFSTSLSAENRRAVGQSLGLRSDLRSDRSIDVTVNPRYGTQGLSLLPAAIQPGQIVSLVDLPFTTDGNAAPVVDSAS
jgi:hypothetical protein